MYCVLSFRVNCLFAFNCSGVDDMGGYLKGINQETIQNGTNMNSFKGPSSLEEARKLAAVISAASDNSGSECNNEIVTETDEYNEGSVKPSPPSAM